MIQQESDNLDLSSRTSNHQGRHSIGFLDIDITSQGEETIDNLETVVDTSSDQSSLSLFTLNVDLSLRTSPHQGRPSVFILGIDITSQGEETINSLESIAS